MSNILKFEEFINEGFLSKTLDRYRSGEVRKEDEISSNIDELKPIDLGYDFMFADIDFELSSGVNQFTWKESNNYQEYFKKHGWRLPTEKEFKKLRGKLIPRLNDDGTMTFVSKLTDELVFISDPNFIHKTCYYWCEEENNECYISKKGDDGASVLFSEVREHGIGKDKRDASCNIRLVKDKQ